MIAVDLLMAKSTASRLYQITLNPVLMDVSYMKRLPASWGTWYKLSKLKPERLRSFIEDGKVNPDMEQWQAEALVKSEPDCRPLKKRRMASQHRSSPAASAGSSDSVDDEDTESNTGEDTVAATEPDAEQIALAGEDALDTLKEALARTRIPIEDVRLHGDVTTRAMVAHELAEHVLTILVLAEELELAAKVDTDSQSGAEPAAEQGSQSDADAEQDSQSDAEPSAEQGSQPDAEPLPALTATQQEQVQAACATLSARDAFLQDLAVELARCQQPITDEDLRIAMDGLLWAEP
jgi:hypothetical protein